MLPVKDLFEFIREREGVRIRRARGDDPPWTIDPILQNYHFCNVQRRDDRGTKERFRVIHAAKVDYDDLPWAYALSNLFNYAPSLEIALEGRPRWDWVNELEERIKCGEKVFHTAYVVSTCGASMSKVEYCARLAAAVRGRHIADTSCQEAYDDLRRIKGMGSFLAGQVIADLKYDRYLVGTKVPDFHHFSVMGPGSKKGLDFIYGGGTTHSNYQQRIREVYEVCMQYGGWIGNITMQDFQNCLCEFSKYIRYRDKLPGRRRPYHVQS